MAASQQPSRVTGCNQHFSEERHAHGIFSGAKGSNGKYGAVVAAAGPPWQPLAPVPGLWFACTHFDCTVSDCAGHNQASLAEEQPLLGDWNGMLLSCGACMQDVLSSMATWAWPAAKEAVSALLNSTRATSGLGVTKQAVPGKHVCWNKAQVLSGD